MIGYTSSQINFEKFVVNSCSMSRLLSSIFGSSIYSKECHRWNRKKDTTHCDNEIRPPAPNIKRNKSHVVGIQSAVISKNHEIEIRFDSIIIYRILFVFIDCCYWQSARNQNKTTEYRWNTLSLNNNICLIEQKFSMN